MMTFDETQLTSDEQPDRLQSLAIEAQKQPPESPQRHRAITLLIRELGRQPTFGILRANLRRHYCSLSNGFFDDLFNEALQETFIAINRFIDRYDSRRPLLNLICKIVSNKFSNLHKKHSRYGVTRVPKPKEDNHKSFNKGRVISLDGLEDFVRDNIMGEYLLDAEVKSISNCDSLRELLINDPDNKFQEHVRNKPHITFQYIAIYLYVKGNNMQQLADKLGISYQTLNSFFKRKLKSLEPYFRDKLRH
jgi:hypothetical protein